ncbi:MAG TPA: universal stress protein [Dongiaceae bacterium]|jgi:nucleotide-binding universal stress UspA family protein|nr:universal stress protein [Dongiaceae bacterium]
MAYKHILTLLLGYDGDGPALRAAVAMAEKMEAAVTALHIRADALAETPLMVDVGVALGELVAAAEKHIERRAQLAKANFESVTSSTCVYREEKGAASELLPRFGRMSDLIVLGRPQAKDAATAMTMDIEYALFGTGRPVLLVPAQEASRDLFDHIVIGWNDSVEATHAVAAGLPVLAKARRVSLVSLPDAPEAQQSLPALIRYLGCHGISAQALPAPSATGSAATHLLQAVQDARADLVMMGAYTHSRLRQLVLGGNTTTMIAHAPIPVFMMH